MRSIATINNTLLLIQIDPRSKTIISGDILMSDTMQTDGSPSGNQSNNPELPQIGIVDLQNALRIIDAAAERGAFKGSELTAVGATRDRFAAFLAAVQPDAKPPAGERIQ
jgi:hypothetical protein